MKTTSRSTRLATLLAILTLSMLAVAPTQAAPAANNRHQYNSSQCRNHKLIPFWGSRSFIAAQGFNFDIVGDQASAKFRNNLSLDLASNPATSDYTASRLTEIDTWEPIADRVKCWQATPTKSVAFATKLLKLIRPKMASEAIGMIAWVRDPSVTRINKLNPRNAAAASADPVWRENRTKANAIAVRGIIPLKSW